MIQVNYFVPNKLSTSDKFDCYLGAPWIGTTLHSRSECLWFNWWLIYRVRKITEFTVLANCFFSLAFYKWWHSSSHTLLTFDHIYHIYMSCMNLLRWLTETSWFKSDCVSCSLYFARLLTIDKGTLSLQNPDEISLIWPLCSLLTQMQLSSTLQQNSCRPKNASDFCVCGSKRQTDIKSDRGKAFGTFYC